MPVLRNISQLATCRADGAQGDIHAIAGAAMAWRGATITWVGVEADLPVSSRDQEEIDAGGRLVVPGLIDCHTHLAFAGWRKDEFERRLRGASYLDIARAGGGIARTVTETRAAAETDLVARAGGFLAQMMRLGVTTVEAKSGYGLTLADELKILRVYRTLASAGPVDVVSTFLGAHAIAPEYHGNRHDYIDLLCDEMVPRVAREGLASFCDVFVEEGAFTVAEGRRILDAGRRHGLRAKVHADQLSDGGGAALAAAAGAVSADHLEHVSADGIRALQRAGTVAVSLPIATATLAQPPLPARVLVGAGVPVAVATDFNPGTAPSFDLPLALWLACVLQRMTPAEALKGATIIAARAIGRDDRQGSLELGKDANLAIVEAEDVDGWLYHFRPQACHAVFARGQRAPPGSAASRVGRGASDETAPDVPPVGAA
jgi:imidazolonepropionase